MDETLLIIDVADPNESPRRRMAAAVKAAFAGKSDIAARYYFQSHEQLHATLTPERWAILHALMGAGSVGVRELARRVNRDVKNVHTDTTMLANCGLIRKSNTGKLEFPYRTVQVQYAMRAA
jgi:predicted transcriptional regulator